MLIFVSSVGECSSRCASALNSPKETMDLQLDVVKGWNLQECKVTVHWVCMADFVGEGAATG